VSRKGYQHSVQKHLCSTPQSQYASVGPDPTFFEESSVYWSPSSDSRELYQQLADKKYREIFRHQIQ